MNPADFVTLSDGNTYELEGYGGAAPEVRDQLVKQAERSLRVMSTANTALDQGYFGGRVPPEGPDRARQQFTTALDEFGRNYTMGLGDYGNAAASYLFDEGTPFEDLPFLERRDVSRAARDIRAGEIPDWLDNAASLAGVLSIGVGPGSVAAPAPLGIVPAAKMGATIGAIEGAGNSEAEDWVGTAGDLAFGTGVGGAVGAGADLALRGVGNVAQKMFGTKGGAGRLSSAEAWEAMDRLGIPPSVGVIGNESARVLENAVSQSPITSVISAALPHNWVMGRSAPRTRQVQEDLLESALQREVTDPLRPPGSVPVRTDPQLSNEVRRLSEQGYLRNKDAIRDMEIDFQTFVPGVGVAPVDMAGPRALPQDVIAGNPAKNIPAGQSISSAQRIEKEIATVDRNMGTLSPDTPFGTRPNDPLVQAVERNVKPINPQLDQQLRRQYGALEADIANRKQQLVALQASPNQTRQTQTQISRLSQSIEKKQEDLRKMGVQIYENMGPSFNAVRQDRSLIGQQTDQTGLQGGEKRMVYGALTDALGDAAERQGGPGARSLFTALTEREKLLFADQELLKAFRTGKVSAEANEIRNATIRGDWQQLDALYRTLTPDEKLAFQADLIDTLGRNAGKQGDPETFALRQFVSNWKNMPEQAKAILFENNPEGRAIADTIALVAEEFSARGRLMNHSNTAPVASTLGGLWATVTNPVKWVSFVATTIGVERAVVSKALADAVAGKPTDLGQLMRRAAVIYAGQNDLLRDEGAQ